MTSGEDLEASKPLLGQGDDKSYGAHSDGRVAEPKYDELLADADYLPPKVDDPMTYNLGWLKSWRVFYMWKDTVWDNSPLWKVMGRLYMLAIFTAVLTYNLMPDPTLLDATKFSEITAVLSLFVTLMLSFFLSSSVTRWIGCVSGFLELFNSIRNLAMQLHTLGVPNERIDMALRYGVLSAHFLVYELRLSKTPADKKTEVMNAMWKWLESCPSTYSQVLESEKNVLLNISDRAGQMWVWVGSLVGRMALDGEIPPMPSPTYGRIMNLAQQAQSGLRQVRTSIVVQMPFVYVHTLACLVHTNCIMLALALGFASGTTIHSIRQYVHHYYYEEHPDPSIQVEPLTVQIQALIVELLKGTLGPLLFQAFLEIAISVVSPFSDADAAIPVKRLIAGLEIDLKQAADLANNCPHWDQPYFKKPADVVVAAPATPAPPAAPVAPAAAVASTPEPSPAAPSDPPIEKPSAEQQVHVDEPPLAAERPASPAAAPAAEEPAAEEPAGPPAAEGPSASPVAAPATEGPAAEEPAGPPAVEGPSAQDVAEHTASEEQKPQ